MGTEIKVCNKSYFVFCNTTPICVTHSRQHLSQLRFHSNPSLKAILKKSLQKSDFNYEIMNESKIKLQLCYNSTLVKIDGRTHWQSTITTTAKEKDHNGQFIPRMANRIFKGDPVVVFFFFARRDSFWIKFPGLRLLIFLQFLPSITLIPGSYHPVKKFVQYLFKFSKLGFILGN